VAHSTFTQPGANQVFKSNSIKVLRAIQSCTMNMPSTGRANAPPDGGVR